MKNLNLAKPIWNLFFATAIFSWALYAEYLTKNSAYVVYLTGGALILATARLWINDAFDLGNEKPWTREMVNIFAIRRGFYYLTYILDMVFVSALLYFQHPILALGWTVSTIVFHELAKEARKAQDELDFQEAEFPTLQDEVSAQPTNLTGTM